MTGILRLRDFSWIRAEVSSSWLVEVRGGGEGNFGNIFHRFLLQPCLDVGANQVGLGQGAAAGVYVEDDGLQVGPLEGFINDLSAAVNVEGI